MEPEHNPTLMQIETFLQEMIAQLHPIHTDPHGLGRPRILPSACLWAGVVVCVLRGWSSQLAIWRLLTEKRLWDYPRFPISDQAIYKRLEAGGSEPLRELFLLVTRALAERLAPFAQPLAAFASQVVAIDQTTLDQVARYLPALREIPKGARQLLAGKLAGVYDIRTQQWRQVAYIEDPDQNEKVAAWGLLAHIAPKALILMDLGFFSFRWFDHLTQTGYFWISRLRQKTSYQVVHSFYQHGSTFDGLVWLGAHRADRAKHMVRLVSFSIGQAHYSYLTNVLEPQQLSLHDIALLYARRWDIELAFKLIKRELGLRLFWSSKQTVVLQQIWAVLLISQILHALQLEIAARAGVDPFDVSIHLLAEYLPRWQDVDFLALAVERGKHAGFIRPSKRIRIHTPPVDLNDYRPPPPDLLLVRMSRYAQRRC